MKVCKTDVLRNQVKYDFNFYPRDAIKAGIATAIRPIAAVAVSNDVLTLNKILIDFTK